MSWETLDRDEVIFRTISAAARLAEAKWDSRNGESPFLSLQSFLESAMEFFESLGFEEEAGMVFDSDRRYGSQESEVSGVSDLDEADLLHPLMQYVSDPSKFGDLVEAMKRLVDRSKDLYYSELDDSDLD